MRRRGEPDVPAWSARALVWLSICGSIPSPAAAQGAGEPTCIALLVEEARAARFEWLGWIGAGRGAHRAERDRRRRTFTAGGEGSFGLARFPTGYGGAFLLRAGPWAGGSTAFEGGGSLEGGLHLSFGQESHAQWGTYTLRAGVGHGDDLATNREHFVVTVTGGVHSFLGRYSERGACDSAARPARHGQGRVLRLFATYRRTFDTGDTVEQWMFGLEISPRFFDAPISWLRLAGGAPR